jgi:hypothetical protein
MSTYLKYKGRHFNDEDLRLVRIADEISQRYEKAGMAMTIRQLHYQFVTDNIYPNEKRSYDKLKMLVKDGRMAGLISWTAIEDRVRNLVSLPTYVSPRNVLEVARESYRTDLWAGQPMRPEVWCEKDALSGVLEPICADERVDFFACRGYNSASEQWRAGQRFAGYVMAGQRPVVIHLGDHDPSGIHMTEDNRDRLAVFAGVPVLVVRIALNLDQIEHLRLPPNYAKVGDSRFKDYEQKFGDKSWELDALPPVFLRDLVVGAIAKYRDPKLWDNALAQEANDKLELDDLIDQFGDSDGG